ncbi:hypothetical protein GT037_008113 [Alternaria burnsii]|uniref:HD domain-containing protein n=2 Tax=Alternaria sect. Alternaria TaxID=2499237 RepID=A0A4Q4N2H2_ALTAL|nr:uncharacterized protein GT037_008113 [Alternaria burnsii]XP_051583072.1 uncharacterized protein J4E82_010954 [Alternaria postmessia]KAF7673498.1 hypothetical protein GT037_008113 [Alternaria burnsii]KAI5366936.1 hypothetical protein J4E82_010954 [Alternaria postmessia]RYN67321.1 hypothetical protein AA0117_g11650 [Alternaria alternata]
MVAVGTLATRIIAGVTVPDTPLINASISLAREALSDRPYNHVMRAWLNGQTILNKMPPEKRATVDEEAFAIGAILHDMGWAFDTEYVSDDKRFEVDGANVARELVRKQGANWDKHREQLLWDAVALHTSPDIAAHKELEVALVSGGTFCELAGPEIAKQSWGDLITVTQDEWAAIAAEFPRDGMKDYLIDTTVRLCSMKPETTYNNFQGDFGEKYLEGYSREGKKIVDLMDAFLP